MSIRGNHLDIVRRRNLATVLGIVHRAGALSRSELTRVTGLNRSTVGALVAELAALGLVRETEPAASNRVGRPSPVVEAQNAVVAIAVNPEVDAITVGVVGLGGVVQHRVRTPMGAVPSAAEAVRSATAAIDAAVRELGPGVRIVGVGVAVPGLVSGADGVVALAPHLAWVDEPFARDLEVACGLPVRAANDANLGATAEWYFGAGRGATDLLYLNGGASGIGGGVIVSGAPLTGIAGYAGELGHTLVNSAGIRCHCGAVGCLETEVSQERLLRALGMAVADSDELERALSSSTDPAVEAEVERQVGFLAVALRNAVNLFNPQRIVLGGFLGALLAVAPDQLASLVTRDALAASARSLTIVRAELGARILMVGAAELAFSALLDDPAGAIS